MVHGEARFTGSSALVVDGRTIRFRHALLAMGASPAVPRIPGLAGSSFLTSDTVWDLRELPKDLVILGGGSIGCELGQAFARLGANVSIVEATSRLIPNEDPEAARLVTAAMTGDGVRVLTGKAVVGVEPDTPGTPATSTSGVLLLADGSTIRYGELLIGVGRKPRTAGIGLEAVGVEVDEAGCVVVDRYLRTSNARIWAAGDLTGHPQFTHTAGAHGNLAASNAALGLRRKVDLRASPRVTFTEPEVASVGVSTSVEPPGGRVVEWHNSHVDRAVAEGQMAGFTRLALDGRGVIVGATIVAPRAGESIGELTLAIHHRLRARALAATTHPYPTYNDGLWNAAVSDLRSSVASPPAQRVLGVVLAVRRRFLDIRTPIV